jgi:hypothetical protein
MQCPILELQKKSATGHLLFNLRWVQFLAACYGEIHSAFQGFHIMKFYRLCLPNCAPQHNKYHTAFFHITRHAADKYRTRATQQKVGTDESTRSVILVLVLHNLTSRRLSPNSPARARGVGFVI